MTNPIPPSQHRLRTIAQMAQSGLSNATIAGRLDIRARSVRVQLSKARAAGLIIPSNAERVAHEKARSGIQLAPLSEAEIERLERAASARGISGRDILDRVARSLLDSASFPALLDNVLDDDVVTP